MDSHGWHTYRVCFFVAICCFLGFFVLQRCWGVIAKYRSRMSGVKLFMALGATIDFEAGNIKRAPKLVQILAMEWFYRFLKEPKRLFRRYFIDDIQFFYYFAKQLLGLYKDPFA